MQSEATRLTYPSGADRRLVDGDAVDLAVVDGCAPDGLGVKGRAEEDLEPGPGVPRNVVDPDVADGVDGLEVDQRLHPTVLGGVPRRSVQRVLPGDPALHVG